MAQADVNVSEQIENESDTDDIHDKISDLSVCYHGTVTRKEAEKRLEDEGLGGGSYLIRKKNKIHVLSLLTSTNEYLHYSIQNLLGYYELGGRTFKNLRCLVSRYYVHDIHLGERLCHPVHPHYEIPGYDEKRACARIPYIKRPDTDELSFKAGTIFIIEREEPEGWLWVTTRDSGEHGYVHTKLVEEINVYPESVERLEFFHPIKLSLDDVKTMLMEAGHCSFLLRPSESVSQCFALLFYVKSTIHKFRISCVNGGRAFLVGSMQFPSMEDVIAFYRREPIVEGSEWLLGTAVTRNGRPTPADEEDIYEVVRQSKQAPMLIPSNEVEIHGEMWRIHKKKKKKLYLTLNSTKMALVLYDMKRTRTPKAIIQLETIDYLPVHDSLHDKRFCLQIVKSEPFSGDTQSYVLYVETPTMNTFNTNNIPGLSWDTFAGAASVSLEASGRQLTSAEETFNKWVGILRRYCRNTRTDAAREEDPARKKRETREYREIMVQICSGRGLPNNKYMSCTISLGDHPVAKTQTRLGPDPEWDEEFRFEKLPSGFDTIAISVRQKKKDSETLVRIPLRDIPPLDGLDKAYELPSGGRVTLKLRFKKLNVKPFNNYSTLSHVLIDEMDTQLVPLNDFSFPDLSQMARSLLNIAIYRNKHTDLIVKLFTQEIKKLEKDSLFRHTTLATAILDEYVRKVAGGWLTRCLSSVLQAVVNLGTWVLEVNPALMQSEDVLPANKEKLNEVFVTVIEDILANTSYCPPSLRYIYHQVQQEVVNHWPDAASEASILYTRVVCNLVFLRVICPALTTNKASNLYQQVQERASTGPILSSLTSSSMSSGLESLSTVFGNTSLSASGPTGASQNPLCSDAGQRTLKLLAKGLMGLAGRSKMGQKELFMEALTPTVESYRNRMNLFITQITNPLTDTEREALSEQLSREHKAVCSVSLSKEMADIHCMLSSQLHRIRNLTEEGTLDKLVMAVEAIDVISSQPPARPLITPNVE